MMKLSSFLLLFLIGPDHTESFANTRHRASISAPLISETTQYLFSRNNNDLHDDGLPQKRGFEHTLRSFAFGLALSFASWNTALPEAAAPPPAMAADGAQIATCLFKKCQLPLAKCIANPKCLANVICINTCNDKEDETGCQIQCGDLFENDVVGEFNKCAVSDMDCVPRKLDDGSYPIPSEGNLVSKFDTSFFNGRLYITAGQNPLFDIFPCQVHFFTETKPGTFFGKLNWRIEEPDGEFFSREALQRFVQDPAEPAHLLNHDNEYLHYQDDWYIVDAAYDKNPEGVPPFAFVYYRGSNDAWDGYGGAVVYTRAAKLPTSLIPRLRTAAAKVGMDFDKDFALTDNTCPVQSTEEKLLLRERFAGNVALQTEKQAQALATRVRGTASNGAKAQKLFIESQLGDAGKAFEELSDSVLEFEREATSAAKTTNSR
uniref:VDE lipocalin domain-containing protein n=1 Tax=Grammatophora oceanica TaxID=210454 RepID=A0A7S1UXP5_9STRA|mmetsp:Transcript_28390/g.41837  ORF Transcript_28390/g.41837 Transcript_28390/m.41837 type:complete len:432 (+) Transcript_28390:62-1357(+)